MFHGLWTCLQLALVNNLYSTRRFVVCLSVCHFVLVFFSPFSIASISYFCSVCACLDLSVSSSSWGRGRAAVCDCGTPWTFLLPFFIVIVGSYPVVYTTDRSKAVTPVLVLLFVALWFILWGDMFYVLPCVILFLCFSVLLALRFPRLGKRELILVLFVRLFDLCLFG